MIVKEKKYNSPILLEPSTASLDTALRQQNRAFEVSLFVDENPSKIVENPEPYTQTAKQIQIPSLVGLQQSLAENSTDPDLALQQLSDQALKIQEATGVDDFYLEGALTYGNPNFNPASTRRIVNQQIGAEEFEAALRGVEEDTSWFGYATDFVDRYLFRQLPIGAIEDVTLRTTRKGGDLVTAARTMNPKEYRQYIRGYIDELKSEGFFKSENWFALQQGLEELQTRGNDPFASLNVTSGLVDIATAPFAGKLITRITKLGGPQAGAEAAVDLSKKGEALDPEVLNETMVGVVDPIKGTIKPTAQTVDANVKDSVLMRNIEHYTKIGSFGRRATEEELADIASQTRERLANTINYPIADIQLESRGLGEYFGVVKLGKLSDGSPFPTSLHAAQQAKSFREKGLVVTNELVDPSDPNKGWYNVVREPIDQSRIGRDLELPEMNFVTRNIARVFGSTRLLDDPAMNTMAMMTESAKALLVREAKPYLKKLEALNVREQDTLNALLSELRDGADASMRRWYTDDELAIKWKDLHGTDITPKQRDAFDSLVTLSDAGYMIQASDLVRHYVRHGYRVIQDKNTHFLGKIADDAKPEDWVYDYKSGGRLRRSDLPADTVVWRTTKEVDDKGTQLVANPKKLQNVEHRHALAYNSGGARMNPHANWFIVAGEKNNRGVALLTAFSQKQAASAVDELSNIRKQFLSIGRPLDTLTNELDDAILQNNNWNPSITNTQDLVKWAKETGWDLTEEVKPRAKDSRLEETGDLWDNVPYEFFARANMQRSDQVLMEYGGKKTFNYSPTKGIVDQLSNTFNEYAFKNYTESAKVSFVKKSLGVDKLPNKNLDELFITELERLKGKATTRADERQLIDFGNIIQRRSHVKSEAVSAFERAGQELREFVFDKSSMRINPGDPTNTLLRLGFQSAFGFFNISQFFMQASQMGAIVAISPRHGLKAAGAVPAFRLALHAGTDEAAARVGKIMGWTTEETKEVFEFFRSTAREFVESDALEKNIGPGVGVSGFDGNSYLPSLLREGLYRTSKVGEKALDAGLAPFREGEKFSRYTGILTAISEYKAKNPGASVLADGARSVITSREQRLSFDMTTASRASFQSGLMRIPTQWLGYSFRAMEAVSIGRDLTKAERIRLGFFLASLGGLGGFGGVVAADEVMDWMGVDPDSPAVAAWKYGVFDAILSYGISGATDEDIKTAMGSRLAPLGTFMELYQRITEDSAYQVLAGPSGDIVGGGVIALWNGVGNLYNGRYLSAVEDVERAVRTVGGINNVLTAKGIFQYNTYRSKSGRALDAEFSDTEGWLAAMGVTNYKVTEFWDASGEVFRSERDFRQESRELQTRFREAIDIIQNGDLDYGNQLIRELEARITIGAWAPEQERRLRRSLRDNTSVDFAVLASKLYEKERDFWARMIESMGENN